MKRFWMSFSGEDGPRGVVLMEAEDQRSAIKKALKLKINPGGQVLFFEMPKDDPECSKEWDSFEKDRLYSPKEMKDIGKRVKTTKEIFEWEAKKN